MLLVRRGKPPGEGELAVPGGRVQYGESLQVACAREVFEETGIRVSVGDPIYAFDSIERDEAGRTESHYVVVDLQARSIGGTLQAGDDATEAFWLSIADIKQLPPEVLNEHTERALRKLGFL